MVDLRGGQEIEIEFIDLEPTTIEREVERALKEAGFLKGLSQEEKTELLGFVVCGIESPAGADIGTYVQKHSSLHVDAAIKSLGKTADKTWGKEPLRKVLFPEWDSSGKHPTRPAVTYAIYNWVISYMATHPGEIKIRRMPRTIPLCVWHKTSLSPNRIPPA